MSIQSDKLRFYFEGHGIKQKEIADKMNITPAAVSNMLAGRDPIGRARAARLAEIYGFSYLFLTTGEGDLLQDDKLISHPVNQATIRTNNGSVTQTANTSPSVNDLLERIEDLKAQVAKEREEKEWLRGLVDKLTPSHN